jgi:hypothetical protein
MVAAAGEVRRKDSESKDSESKDMDQWLPHPSERAPPQIIRPR